MANIEQYVCKVCGYNMVGYFPESCPFCGASNDNFMTTQKCSSSYDIKEINISKNVKSLNSYPALGIEHTAYQINTGESIVWIDCPSTFRKNVNLMDYIIFTHHHFLGASNIYQKHFGAEVWIHLEDSKMSLAEHHTFTKTFQKNFTLNGIEAFHINGHTKGFTFYIFENILFECDYTFFSGNKIKFNPYGNRKRTLEGGRKMNNILQKYDLDLVCGVDYTSDYETWFSSFISLL